MIKVIKVGKVVHKPLYTSECDKCGCVFTAEYSDVKAEDRPCSDPYLECPTVGCKNRVVPHEGNY